MDTFRASSFDGVFDTSRPPTVMVPASMPMRRPIIVSSVDLPAPFGPTMAVMPPGGISRSTGPIATSEV